MIGNPAPEFSLHDQNRELVTNDSLKGSKAMVVFMPFPFTGICDGEACTILDNYSSLTSAGAKVVIITVHAVPTNIKWAAENNIQFPVLSDYWPHGEVAKRFGVFDDTVGAATRATFVLDEEGVIRAVVATDSLKIKRELENYTDALASF